jgi:hypothetical protein
MILTVATATQLLPLVVSLVGKIYTALTTPDPVSIDEEIAQLEALRLRNAEEIIADADKASGK